MTSNIYLDDQAKKLKFKNWRGVIFTDELSSMKPKIQECAIIGSRPSTSNEDMHWCAYFKYNSNKYYFDSFGNPPDDKLVKYLKTNDNNKILTNTFQLQRYDEDNCGEWCLWFLNNMNKILLKNKKIKDQDFVNIILSSFNKE